METMMSRTLSVHKEHEVLLKLEAAGLTDDLAQRVINSKGNDLATKVVRLIQNGGLKATTSQKRAREIMGNNFFGVEEATRYFGIRPWATQLVALSEIPFTEATLERYKDSHILVAVFPMSILEIRSVANSSFYCQDWYDKESFVRNRFEKDRDEVSWQLVRKTAASNSTSKSWKEQQDSLAKNEGVPTARVLVYATIGHFLSTGEKLFDSIYVRCSCVDSCGRRVYVGYFNTHELSLGAYWGDYRYDDLGVSSTRKLD